MNSPIRIAIACSGLGHITRGIEAWASDLGRVLADRGENVTLFKGGGSIEAEYERVLPCWQRMAPRTQALARWTKHGLWRWGLSTTYELEEATFTWNLLKELRRNRIDILHVQDPQIGLFAQRAHQLGWVPTRVILGHGTNEPYPFLKKIKYLQHLAPYYLKEAETAGYWKPTWTAIPNFIDTDLFRPGKGIAVRSELGIPPDGLVVLCAAAINRGHKRIHYLVAEVDTLLRRNPELPVWLVVAGAQESDTGEIVRQGRAKLGDRIRFLIDFPRARMPELYSSADVFTLCSLREMLGIVLLEAASSGLPCLVHRHPVLEWVTGPGGIAVDMEKPCALADALLQLLGKSATRLEVGRQARDYSQANFSRGRVVEQILSYYRFVLTHDRPAKQSITGQRLTGCEGPMNGWSSGP